ncbi:MAG: hypothetical protein ABI589_06175, partial [Burkholderiales bacterium]
FLFIKIVGGGRKKKVICRASRRAGENPYECSQGTRAVWPEALSYIHVFVDICKKRLLLATAKFFTSGNRQAVRLPKAVRLDPTEM